MLIFHLLSKICRKSTNIKVFATCLKPACDLSQTCSNLTQLQCKKNISTCQNRSLLKTWFSTGFEQDRSNAIYKCDKIGILSKLLKIDVCRNGLTDRWVDVQPIAKSRSSVAERDKIGKTSKMVLKNKYSFIKT